MANNSKTILIVEDEALLALEMRLKLERAGFDPVRVAATGAEALAEVNSHHPDLVLMDIGLPGELNGIDTAISIRNVDKTVPILFVSGYSDRKIKAEAAKVHPVDYLVKPIEFEKILDSINTGISSRQA